VPISATHRHIYPALGHFEGRPENSSRDHRDHQ
jgi:hypothetical protein